MILWGGEEKVEVKPNLSPDFDSSPPSHIPLMKNTAFTPLTERTTRQVHESFLLLRRSSLDCLAKRKQSPRKAEQWKDNKDSIPEPSCGFSFPFWIFHENSPLWTLLVGVHKTHAFKPMFLSDNYVQGTKSSLNWPWDVYLLSCSQNRKSNKTKSGSQLIVLASTLQHVK